VLTEALSNGIYRVAALRTTEGRRYATMVHVSHIKGYYLPSAVEDEPTFSDKEENEDEADILVEEKSTTTKESTVGQGERRHPKSITRPPEWQKLYKM